MSFYLTIDRMRATLTLLGWTPWMLLETRLLYLDDPAFYYGFVHEASNVVLCRTSDKQWQRHHSQGPILMALRQHTREIKQIEWREVPPVVVQWVYQEVTRHGG